MSSGVYPPVTCWPEVVEWREDPEHVNPITIEVLSQLSGTVAAEHYPLFHLAFRYLVDPKGLGRTLLEVKALFADIRDGIDFSEALENRLGMNRDYYEEKFWSLMKAFLPDVCDQDSVFRIYQAGLKWFELPPVDTLQRR